MGRKPAYIDVREEMFRQVTSSDPPDMYSLIRQSEPASTKHAPRKSTMFLRKASTMQPKARHGSWRIKRGRREV